jgi:hypothetical protein
VVRWNTDKRYLLDLQRAGVAIVPTEVVTRDRPVDLAALCATRGWRDIVVKPAIGASASGAERFTDDSIVSGGAAQAHLGALLLHGHALVQPARDLLHVGRVRDRCEGVLGVVSVRADQRPGDRVGAGVGRCRW